MDKIMTGDPEAWTEEQSLGSLDQQSPVALHS